MHLHKLRFESFGGIAGVTDPVSLVWLSRDQVRRLGYEGGTAWQGSSQVPGDDGVPLAAGNGGRSSPVAPWMWSSRPVEAELTITTRCLRSCPCCYAGGTPDGRDVPYDVLVQRLDYLATLDLFHVALSGGEPLLHPDLFQLAEQVRDLAMLPSTTTSGPLVTSEWATRAAELFARVNVSVDFPGGPRGYVQADTEESFRALRMLSLAGVTTGASFILTRQNLDRLPELFQRAVDAGADSILLLRLKPSGRGLALYESSSVLPDQTRPLLAELARLCTLTGLDFHLDCALAPIVLSSTVPDEPLARWAASGCVAGTLLTTVDAAGRVHACSHLDIDICDATELPNGWLNSADVNDLRSRWNRQTGTCASCRRVAICGGGCAAVNQRLGLALDQPDPDLPCTEGEGSG